VPVDRREFLALAASGVAATMWPAALAARAPTGSHVKAVVFDAFPIFDPRPISALAETLFPGKGASLTDVWRTRQFEYQWLRALAGHYADFWQTTEEALAFAAKTLKLDLPPEKRAQLMRAYLGLTAWPDVPAAVRSLQEAGVRLALLSNMTPRMLEVGIKNANLDGVFERVISTDRIQTYKPDPRAYRMAVDAMKLKRDEILFAAFAGWDAAGAKWFGYRTFWVNRLGLPEEELDGAADATGRGLTDLVSFAHAGH